MQGTSAFSVETDNIGKEGWDRLLDTFSDSNIYQTWSYEAVKSGEENLSHLILKRDGEIVAAAQARIARLPLTSMGVAYVRWGPMWRRRGKQAEPEIFARAVRALRSEYACNRGLVVKILPVLFDDQAAVFAPMLGSESYVPPPVEIPQRTLLIDLDRPLEELRKGLDQKWRNCLNRAEKNQLTVVEGADDSLFGHFERIYEQTRMRKKFEETSDVAHFRKVQRYLPNSQKTRVFLAYSGPKPAAGVICSGIGDMGVYLFGGTSDAGLNAKGSYLLQWKALKWLREQGSILYNLHGVNRMTNPGTYHFKTGFCGKNGKELSYLGAYDAWHSATKLNLFRLADSTRKAYFKARRVFNFG